MNCMHCIDIAWLLRVLVRFKYPRYICTHSFSLHNSGMCCFMKSVVYCDLTLWLSTSASTSSPLQSPWQEGPMLFRQASLPPQRSAPAPIAAVDYSHHSPPGGHHPAPKAHSSPRGSQRSRAARYASCRSPARSFDEQDGPSSADSFGGHTGELLSEGSPQHHHHHHLQQHQQQQQQFHQPPLLPEKRRASDGEHSLGSASPALSGFSSPHSGSSLSIPFPNVLPEGQGRGTPGTSSPLPGKHPNFSDTMSEPNSFLNSVHA